MSFNPNSPNTLGNEWKVWQQTNVNLPSAFFGVGVRVNSTATETVDAISIPYQLSGSGYAKLWAEIYDAADLGTMNESPTVNTFTPNEDVAVNALMYSAAGLGSEAGPISVLTNNVDQYVNETSDTDNYFGDPASDYIRAAHPMHGISYASFAFNTSALAAGRVLSMSLEIRCTGDQQFGVDLYNGTTFVRRLATVFPDRADGTFTNKTIGPFYTNPLTDEPWTRTDIINMDTGTNLLIRVTSIAGVGEPSGAIYGTPIRWCVGAIRMKIPMITEKRVAVGGNTAVTATPDGMQTNNFHTLKTPAGVDNWAKASATNYLVVLRRLDDPDGVLPSMTPRVRPLFSTPPANPHNQGALYTVFVGADGRMTSTPTAANGTPSLPVLIARTDNALSVDSQVYHTLVSGDISTTATKQLFSNAASVSYSVIRAVVGYYTATPPTAPLLFKIKRASDNVQMGGTATLNPEDIGQHVLLGQRNAFIAQYDVQLNMASAATLASGTQYYVEITSTSYPYWVLSWLDYTETHSYTGDQSFGGSTDYGAWLSAAANQSDFVTTVITAPPTAPASITVTSTNFALPTAGDPICDPGVHAVARVSWAATADGLFARYEIQRSEDGGTTWVLVKRVSTEATVTFDDHEAAHGVAIKYRVRVVRSTGTASDWRTQTGTITLPINSQAIVFATNSDTALTVGYLRMGAQHNYRFLSDDEVSLVRMYGRDFSVMFRPTEDRGVQYELPVLIHTRSNENRTVHPTPPGADAFDPLRAVVESSGPYVAVFTPDGVRILAGLRLPTGRRLEPAAYYAATVTATEVASTPSVTDI